jgi:ribonuclease D
MSDWEQRPLSAAQQQYAALDAWVLPQLYTALLGVLGAQEGARLVAQHKGRYVAVGGGPGVKEVACAGYEGGLA